MATSSKLAQAVAGLVAPSDQLPSLEDAAFDIEALIASLNLQRVRRYFRQMHWHEESAEADFSDRVEPGLKLENVAAHSWHVADAALLLLSHFPYLNRERVLSLAVLHDKLEIYTGDFDPVGDDGRGTNSHAFNPVVRSAKLAAEYEALQKYLSSLRSPAREMQRDILIDAIEGRSKESLFVKAVDKLQALAFVYEKKQGKLSDQHLVFSIRYSKKAIDFFPALQLHYMVLLDRLLDRVAQVRRVSRLQLDAKLFAQLELDL